MLRSIQVGQPKQLSGDARGDGPARPWRTSLFKEVVEGPVRLEADGLVGNAQADLVHHGGPDKAVCVYPQGHYAYWETRLDRSLPSGAFGENFSVVDQDEDSVCIGDTFRVGAAVVQVTQPRSPCWKLARRWHDKLALWFQATGRTGWYLRVVQPGIVEPGQPLELVERPFARWTIQRLNGIRHGDKPDRGQLAFLAQCEALSDGWRRRFKNRLARSGYDDDQQRLQGDP